MRKIREMLFLISGLLLLSTMVSAQTAQAGPDKPRTVITTDGEVDDVDSFIRMLLYSNEFEVEGLVYSSSQWHMPAIEKLSQKLICWSWSGIKNYYNEKTYLP